MTGFGYVRLWFEMLCVVLAICAAGALTAAVLALLRVIARGNPNLAAGLFFGGILVGTFLAALIADLRERRRSK